MLRYIIVRKLALATILMMAFGTFAAIHVPYVSAIKPLSDFPCDFDEELISGLGDAPPVGGSAVDYLLYDYHGGTWCDAEKTADNTDDDLTCWAAAASNVLQWTGWGYVVHSSEGAMTDSDEMFAHFNAHWEDQGSLSNIAWMWWFNGDAGLPSNYPNDPPYIGGPADWSEVDVAGGGDFWTPPYNVGDYMHSYSGANTLQAIDDYLHNGWGIALGIYDGGHAITCWGFTYNSSVNKATNPDDYYLGVWVTDSDDDKLHNSWDPPPDRLRYYDVSYDSAGSFWKFDTYGGGGWHISLVYGLEPFPNTAPTAEANGPYTSSEGSAVNFDGSGSTDTDGNPLRYRWDFNNDGVWDTSWSSSPSASHAYPDDYSGTAVVEVSDYMTTSTDTASVTITNAAPIVEAGPDQTVDEGDVVSFSGSFTDPGTGDTHTIEWNFGDGSFGSGSLTPQNVYGDNSAYTVTLTVTDDDGGVGVDTLTVTVNNVAPSIDEMTLSPPNPNNPEFILPTIHDLPFTASASDPGSDDLSFTWDWDDGTQKTNVYYNDGIGPDPYPSPGGTHPFTHADAAARVYSEPGTYTVTLTVEDDDGGSVSATLEVKVLSAEEAKEMISEYIQSLSNTAFRGKAVLRKQAFSNMFAAIDDMLADKEYVGAIEDLRNNIREKADGTVGGFASNDWIIDAAAQQDICWKIDTLIAYLETLL